jgi:hypothetical protein
MKHHRNSVMHNLSARAKALGITGDITFGEWYALKEMYGNFCLACGATDDLEPDHVTPLARGGLNMIENIQPLCRSCNLLKHARSSVDYRHGRKVKEFVDVPEYVDDGTEKLTIEYSTWQSLMRISANTGEKLVSIIARLVNAEEEKTKAKRSV